MTSGRLTTAHIVRIADAELEKFGDELDRDGIPLPTPWSPAALMLAHRGRSLYKGFRHAAKGPSGVVAWSAVRLLLEAWILLRWLELNPELHLELWAAEQERHVRTLIAEGSKKGHPSLGKRLMADLGPERLAQIDRTIAEARAKGLAAGMKIKTGPLLPNLPAMAEAIGADEVSEGYHWAYGFLSSFVHAGAGSFEGRVSVTPNSQVRIDDGPLADAWPARTLAVRIYAFVLRDVSRILGLGIDAEVQKTIDVLQKTT